eukprot:1847007-Pleurochrysis_carterae.AAC.4
MERLIAGALDQAARLAFVAQRPRSPYRPPKTGARGASGSEVARVPARERGTAVRSERRSVAMVMTGLKCGQMPATYNGNSHALEAQILRLHVSHACSMQHTHAARGATDTHTRASTRNATKRITRVARTTRPRASDRSAAQTNAGAHGCGRRRAPPLTSPGASRVSFRETLRAAGKRRRSGASKSTMAKLSIGWPTGYG